VICSVAFPLFVSFTVSAVLEVPTLWFPKLKLVGAKVVPGAAATPLPERLTVCGLPDALSAIEIVPVRVPATVGVNVTVITHDAPAARLDPHVFVCAKSPLAVILLMLKLAVPLFVAVIFWLALVVFSV
jgi:hypothetical protein